MERVQLPYALRDPFRDSHYTRRRVQEPLARGAAISRRRCRPVPSDGLLDLSMIQTDKYEEAMRQGMSRLWAGEDPQDDPRRCRRAVGRADRARSASTSSAPPMRRGPSKPNAYPTADVSQGTAPALAGGRLSRLADRQFKYLAITPAVVDHPADRPVPDRLLGCGQLPEHQHAGGGHLLQRAAQLPAAVQRRALLAGARCTPSSSSSSRCRSS